MKSLLILNIILFSLFGCLRHKLKHEIIAGSEDDFMIVSHYVISGTNYEIGEKIAAIAKKINVKLKQDNSLSNQLQLKYFKENYPIHYQRMHGVASGFGISIYDYSISLPKFSSFSMSAGCSAVFYPGSRTFNTHEIVSRNYDFSIGNFQSLKCEDNELPALSRPILFEIYPDEGYASLYMCDFELLGGVIDGINSEGLCVMNLDDGIYGERLQPEPATGRKVGLHELLILRYLLDNCKNVEEAKEALLFLKQYYSFAPQHYMVADNNGHSFVFEFSRMRNQVFMIDGSDIQCITNHLISNRNTEELSKESIIRLDSLYSMTKDQEKLNLEKIKEINSKVSSRMPNDHPILAASRTLWHSIYDLDKQSLKIKFYLGETNYAENEITPRYSDYLEFHLN